MVGELPRGERAHRPAGEEVRLQQTVAHAAGAVLVEDARPQQVARVRGEAVDLTA
ncbi:hypothetical protein GA0115246_113653, partial [Streptomyces sp. SolWspMP-sol7th]